MTTRATHRIVRAALVAILLFGTGCSRGGEQKTQASSGNNEKSEPSREIRISAQAIQTIGLQTEIARPQEVAQEITTTAVIKPNEYRLARVSPRIPGKAVEVQAKLGDAVKKGQVLAELDSLELGQKKADYLRAEADLNVARRNYEREKSLYAKQISSERDYLAAKGEFERSDAAYNAAREALMLLDLPELSISRMTWSDSRKRLSLFPLTAPFSGTVIERRITVGEQVGPEQAAFTIADLDTVWTLVDIYQRDLGRVALGDRVRIAVDSYPDRVFHGRIVYISNTLDPTTRAASARVEIENPNHDLRLGMFSTAEIGLRPLNGQAGTVAVPTDAIQQDGDRSLVFVEQAPGVYLPRAVSVGPVSGAQVQIARGLSPGERVVTKGSFYLNSIVLKGSIGGGDD